MGNVVRLLGEAPEGAAESGPRRLAAVAFFDVVGYSAKMARNEAEALECVRDFESVLRTAASRAGGRVVKFLGDGAMVEFPTAGAALESARAVIAAVDGRKDGPRYEVRIGIHLGEVVDHAGDIFGDVVNIAARVQPLADQNGIALTEAMHAQVRNHGPLDGGFLPAAKLKNIPNRMRVFLVPPPGRNSRALRASSRRRVFRLAAIMGAVILSGGAAFGLASRKPATIGLLYVRPSDDPEARAFADGLERAIDDRLGGSLQGAQWISRAGMKDLFEQEGADPNAIETLEAKSCKAARRGGLEYTFYSSLSRQEPDGWLTQTKVICTKERTALTSFASIGRNPTEIAEGIAVEIQRWVDENL